MKKTIDIMLPYWGDVALLRQTVDSVIAQTSPDWHLTILDDHYESEEAARYFASLNHPQITYIRHNKNIGITNNFNYAATHASAPYCAILGCDDILLPTYVERALATIDICDFYQPSVEVIDKNGRPYLPITDRVKRILQPNKPGPLQGERLAASLCHGNWLYFPSVVWKTETLQKYRFNDRYKIVEDLVLEIDMIIDGATLYFDTATTFQYRRFAESLSSKEKGKHGIRFTEETAAYKSFEKKFAAIGWHKAEKAARYHITSRINQLLARLSR